MKPFLCSVLSPILSAALFTEPRSQTHHSTKQIGSAVIIDEQDSSENATLRDKTHHSLIAPSESKFTQSRFVVEEQAFNLP